MFLGILSVTKSYIHKLNHPTALIVTKLTYVYFMVYPGMFPDTLCAKKRVDNRQKFHFHT